MSSQVGEERFYQQLKQTVEKVLLYENKDLLQLASAQIPLKLLQDQAKEAAKHGSKTCKTFDERDHLLLLLLRWFKSRYLCVISQTHMNVYLRFPLQKPWRYCPLLENPS